MYKPAFCSSSFFHSLVFSPCGKALSRISDVFGGNLATGFPSTTAALRQTCLILGPLVSAFGESALSGELLSTTFTPFSLSRIMDRGDVIGLVDLIVLLLAADSGSLDESASPSVVLLKESVNKNTTCMKYFKKERSSSNTSGSRGMGKDVGQKGHRTAYSAKHYHFHSPF